MGKIAENFEGKLVEGRQKVVNYSKLSKLIVTRWTVHATCFQKSINNYTLLLKLWDECLIEAPHPDRKLKIIGCQKQMKSFAFYFGLHLTKNLYGMVDNLSKTLQKEKMSAFTGRNLADLNINTFKNI